ncbi:MAG: threonine/serine exporter family protein [Rhodospirillum sp.]|nr:threonine/serine exporter family protein [Rhodospirillum sp.]MCF8489288.1 threonine/serine exporter family protein [Rhodospirillum sp.]MCF8502009.1 threonine/serine exporter family protein [Rhodospirillum sp.]
MAPSVPAPEATDPVVTRHRHLERVAMTALDAGRLLMESGARSHVIRDGAALVARGLGADHVHVRAGYASIGMTVGSGTTTITRMMGVGRHGVNQRLDRRLRAFCARVDRQGMTVDAATAELEALAQDTHRHPWPLVALAVGLACAAFARLLGCDWLAIGAVLLASTVAQAGRHGMARLALSPILVTTLTAGAAALLAGAAARALGSGSPDGAMLASILLLVPGVPLLNAQIDIMEGYPTLGAARAVSGALILVFITVGLWGARGLLGLSPTSGSESLPDLSMGSDMILGAIAAAGFGVLFNFEVSMVAAAALVGALGLAVRALGLGLDWGLPGASFLAAISVGLALRLLRLVHPGAGLVLAVAGCVPMIPGGSAAQAIMGLFALAAPTPPDPQHLLALTVESGLRALITLGAIGAGLTLIATLPRGKAFPD